MADFTFDGRVKVKTLKDEFKKNFGATLRVYTNIACEGEQAADDATLASIRAEGCSGGEFAVKGNMKVATFEKKVAEVYGIGVQVANADDTEFADDAATLMGAATTASAESGRGHVVETPSATAEAPKVQASAAELASARVRVYGKAQNRTALGIVHAYMVMYPQATLEDLRKAFPNEVNPEKGVDEMFIYAEEKGTAANWNGFFKGEDELLTMGDGRKVAFVMMWTKPCFERIVAHAKQYGILVADFEKADGGAKKGGFRLEYLNGYVPPVPEKKKSMLWLWILIILLLLAAIAFFAFGGKKEVVEVEKPVEKKVEVEKVVEVEKIVYVNRIEEIEKNFNAAKFEKNKADLSEEAKFVLHDLAKEMQKHPEIKLRIVGHTSDEGSAARNQELSQERAQSAVDFLIGRGIDASRLEAEGKGSSEPLDVNNREVNRRTEFIVLD